MNITLGACPDMVGIGDITKDKETVLPKAISSLRPHKSFFLILLISPKYNQDSMESNHIICPFPWDPRGDHSLQNFAH